MKTKRVRASQAHQETPDILIMVYNCCLHTAGEKCFNETEELSFL